MSAAAESEPAFLVERPGLLTTIQDLGRAGHYGAGVSVGGAMDRFALTAANLLVGNPPAAAGLEMTMQGPSLVARRSLVVAVTGADLTPQLNGRPLPDWTSCFLTSGDRLSFGERRQGARAYLAVQGGLDGEVWLGSRSTVLLISRGGLAGRQLQTGDQLRRLVRTPAVTVVGRALAEGRRPRAPQTGTELRCLAGPHATRLTPPDRARLFGDPWTVSRNADRMGARLEGGHLTLEIPELLSFGLVPGAVQVPPSGEPIVLLQDHQTAGGYPVVAAVITADLPLAAQLLPGDAVRFVEVSLADAQRALDQRRRDLDGLR